NGKMPTDEHEKKQIAIALGGNNIHIGTHPEYYITNPVENTQELFIDKKRWDKLQKYKDDNEDEYDMSPVYMKDTEGLEEHDGIKMGYYSIVPQIYNEDMAEHLKTEEGYTDEEVENVFQPLVVVTVKIEEDMNVKEAKEIVSKININGRNGLKNFEEEIKMMEEEYGVKEKDIKLLSDSYLEVYIDVPYKEIGIEGQDMNENYSNLIEKENIKITINEK